MLCPEMMMHFKPNLLESWGIMVDIFISRFTDGKGIVVLDMRIPGKGTPKLLLRLMLSLLCFLPTASGWLGT